MIYGHPKAKRIMTLQEKKQLLASMVQQIQAVQIPSYIPGAKDLQQLKEAILLIIEILTTESEQS